MLLLFSCSVEVSYSYDLQPWQPCTPTCGTGRIQRRAARCMQRTSTTMAGQTKVKDTEVPLDTCRQKGLEAAVLTESCQSTDCPYAWRVGSWFECSKTCSRGMQLRAVSCERLLAAGNSIQDRSGSRCSLAKPADRQPCILRSCPSTWSLGNWSTCSKSCSSGLQTRLVTCQRTSDSGSLEVLPDSSCDQRKPTTQEYCNTFVCPPYWEFKEFPKCGPDGSTQTRRVVCRATTPGGYVYTAKDSLCQRDVGQKPSMRRKCEPYCDREKGEYDWYTGEWGLVSIAQSCLDYSGTLFACIEREW